MTDLVFNIRPASPSSIRAMDRHENERVPDKTSAIDPARRHLNETLHGSTDGPQAALDQFYKSGVKRPAKQSETPYLQIVIGASPGYFRPENPDARGTWDQGKMEAWRERSIAWLRAEFGEDLVHCSLHLDEDTPHMHALVAPTYEKKKRVPGRRKKNETEADFEARKQAARDAPGVRTVGRASHATLSQPNSFQRLRESLAVAVNDLGIGYGNDRSANAPDGMSTREWVAQEAVKLRQEAASQIQAFEVLERALAVREQDVKRREAGVLTATSILRRLINGIGDRLGLKLGRTVSLALNQIESELDGTRPTASFSDEEAGEPCEEIRAGF